MKKVTLIFGAAIIVVALLVFTIQIGVQPSKSVKTTTSSSVQVSDIDTGQLSSLINTQRIRASLGSLNTSENLNMSARDKCNDMIARDYWSHNAPDGTEPWKFINKYTSENIYRTAGENLAYGYKNAQQVVDGWMNSKSHRDAILYPQFSQVGYAICKSDNYQHEGAQLIIVQHFLEVK